MSSWRHVTQGDSSTVSWSRQGVIPGGDSSSLSSLWHRVNPAGHNVSSLTLNATKDEHYYDSLSSSDDNLNNYSAPATSEAEYVRIAVLLTLVWSLGIVFNIISLCVFIAHKRLRRSTTNLFVMALNLCDFLMGFFGTFMSMTSAWNRKWMYGPVGCIAEGFTVYFLGLASLYLMAAISFDRYIVIAKPLLRATFATKKAAYVSISTCWLGGFIWAALPLLGWNEYVLEGAGISCSLRWSSNDPVYFSYIVTVFIFAFLLPLGIMVFSYYNVYMTLRYLSMNARWNDNSRVAIRNRNIERRTVKIFVILLGAYIGCWTPYAVVSFMTAFQGSVTLSIHMVTYPAVLAKSQSVINPLLYVATNNRFRQEFCNVLPCSALRNQKPGGSQSDDNNHCNGKKTVPDNVAAAINERNDNVNNKASKEKAPPGGGGRGGAEGGKRADNPAGHTTSANLQTSTKNTSKLSTTTTTTTTTTVAGRPKTEVQAWTNKCCEISETVDREISETVDREISETVDREILEMETIKHAANSC